MVSSRPSLSAADPLSRILEVLGARVTRLTRLEAAGSWAFSFPALPRLKFVALLRGEQWMSLPGSPPRLMRAGDVCLIGPTPYAAASSPVLEPVDGASLFAEGRDLVRIGGDEVVGIGGSVAFAAGEADILLRRLPTFMLIPCGSPGSERVAAVLSLIRAESDRDATGADLVARRLADVLLIEAVRAYAVRGEAKEAGWLGALVEPRVGMALRAMHEDIARRWSVASLAQAAGMSRAAFAAAFSRRVGSSPLEYLRGWRLAVARTALKRGGASIARVAEEVGYSSQSAFSHAYKRRYGTAPRSPGPEDPKC